MERIRIYVSWTLEDTVDFLTVTSEIAWWREGGLSTRSPPLMKEAFGPNAVARYVGKVRLERGVKERVKRCDLQLTTDVEDIEHGTDNLLKDGTDQRQHTILLQVYKLVLQARITNTTTAGFRAVGPSLRAKQSLQQCDWR